MSGVGRFGRRAPIVAAAFGLLVSLVVMGPALGPGSLLNLDLVLVPNPPVPTGMWGLGPDLPRRVPLWGPISWLSTLTDGTTVGKAFIVVALTLAFVGAWHFAGRRGVAPWAAGILYAFGPFLATRTAVGHWQILVVMALLPWAVPSLLAPYNSKAKVVLWCAALGFGGVYGSVVAGGLLLTGMVVERSAAARLGRAVAGLVASFVVTQLPWLVPALVVGWGNSGVSLASASAFTPPFHDLADLGRLLAGQGFWNPPFQIGGDQPFVGAVVGYVLLGLAIVGVSELPARYRAPLTMLALISFLCSISSALPLIGDAVDVATRTSVGAVFRDTQRFLTVYLLWLSVCASLGASRIVRVDVSNPAMGALRGVTTAIPLAIGITLALPSLWGFGGEVRPVRFPEEWTTARQMIEAAPGPVVALPWFEYFTLDLANNRLTLGVVPYYFGGDVITASDPRVSVEPERESADPREPVVAAILRKAQQGEHPSASLAEAGVRWIVLQHDVDWRTYSGVMNDRGLTKVVTGSTLDLYRVDAWRGPVAVGDQTVSSHRTIGPFLDVDMSNAATLARPYQPGWMRGWSSASSSKDGLIALPAGSGLVWFWPALIVLIGDAAAIAAVASAILSHYSTTRRTPRGDRD